MINRKEFSDEEYEKRYNALVDYISNYNESSLNIWFDVLLSVLLEIVPMHQNPLMLSEIIQIRIKMINEEFDEIDNSEFLHD